MSYATLEIGVGWLKNLEPLVDDAQDGLTQADADKAESYADRRINAFFARYYDVTASVFAAAPMIVEIADMLGSARLLEYKFARSGVDGSSLVAELEDRADKLMQSVARSGLVDTDGGLIAPEVRAIIRVDEVS